MSKCFVKIFCFRLIAMIVVTATPMPAMANITNGSFEYGTDPGSYLTLDGGSSAITGWTVIGQASAIDYIGSYWSASDGERSLDLSGNPGPGGVIQVVSTIPGKTYEVKFDMAGNPDGGPTEKLLWVSAFGSKVAGLSDYYFDTTGKTKTNMGWETMRFTFEADAPSTTLQFLSVAPEFYGPGLDNVSMTQVIPAPGALLLGSLGVSVVGWLRRRRTL